MRFMMLMIPEGYDKAPPGTMPDSAAVAAMMRYNEELKEAGILLALEGLHPPSMGARVSFTGGKTMVTDGPFPESKEVIGGYWIIRTNSKQEAVDWAKRCPVRHGGSIEIRQIQEISDFSEEIQPVLAASDDRANPPG